MRMVPGTYQGKKGYIVRPAASGDVGYDPHRSNLVLFRYETPTGTNDELPEVVVPSEEVKKVEE